jgi:hypothetical protein
MGNALSEEEEEQLLEEAFTMSLESPEADKHLNSGTAAPNCQPKHTREKLKGEDEEGQEVIMKDIDNTDPHDDKGLPAKHRRASSTNENDQEDRRKRQQTNQNMSAQQQKKMSYVQMARLGYQELVNAIIRPPRADYKVCRLYAVLTCDHIRLPNGTIRKSNLLTLLNLFWHGIRWKLWALLPLLSAVNGSPELILHCERSAATT